MTNVFIGGNLSADDDIDVLAFGRPSKNNEISSEVPCSIVEVTSNHEINSLMVHAASQIAATNTPPRRKRGRPPKVQVPSGTAHSEADHPRVESSNAKPWNNGTFDNRKQALQFTPGREVCNIDEVALSIISVVQVYWK